MRNLWRYFTAFLKHCYTFLFLLAIDPFDILERLFRMTYSPPRWLTWLLSALALTIALILTIRDLRKQAKYNLIAWAVYDSLSDLFRQLTHAINVKERDVIHSKIERERGKLPDKGLDKLISLFLDSEEERERYGMDSYQEIEHTILREQNERMRNYIMSRYGDRIWEQSTANTASQTE